MISASSSARRAGCHAATSTEPRSPKWLKEYSTRTSHPFGTQHPHKRLDKRRVALVEEPRGFASAPAREDGEAHVERPRDPSRRRQADVLEPPAFEQRDGALADVGCAGDVELAQAAPPADRPEDRADPVIVHRSAFSRPALHRRFAAGQPPSRRGLQSTP